jgi:hypothetical protein
MAKRFTDSEKYKKPFHRGLQGAYKILWDFICHDCDHAGIWHIDFEVAQIYIGSDMPVNEIDALKYFNEGEKRIEVLPGGKWFIRPFIEFQYGVLNPDNRVHLSILNILKKNKIKPLTSPLLGAKDKDKDKDKDKVKDSFDEFIKLYPERNGKKLGQPATYAKFKKLSEVNRKSCIIAAKNYANSKAAKDGYAKDPERFFVNDFWKGWIDPEVKEKDPTDWMKPGSGITGIYE